MRGGKRDGAGRPKGTTRSDRSEVFYARITKEEKEKLKKYLELLRK